MAKKDDSSKKYDKPLKITISKDGGSGYIIKHENSPDNWGEGVDVKMRFRVYETVLDLGEECFQKDQEISIIDCTTHFTHLVGLAEKHNIAVKTKKTLDIFIKAIEDIEI